jgi:hypothetical protein
MCGQESVVPVATSAGDKIEGLRQWASGRCLSADRAECIREIGSGLADEAAE